MKGSKKEKKKQPFQNGNESGSGEFLAWSPSKLNYERDARFGDQGNVDPRKRYSIRKVGYIFSTLNIVLSF